MNAKSLFKICWCGAAASLAALPLPGTSEPAQAGPDRATQVSEVFPTEGRNLPSRLQDDHIHTRPDGPTALFESMDINGDERLEWQEVQVTNMDPEVFNSLDANGSGDLDIEEYLAINPRPGNDYLDAQGREPSPAPDFSVGSYATHLKTDGYGGFGLG